MKTMKSAVASLAVLLAVSVSVAVPRSGTRLTGEIACQLIDENLTVRYLAIEGFGQMQFFQDSEIIYERDIFLTQGFRCDSYAGGCRLVVNAGLRVRDKYQFEVDYHPEVGNVPQLEYFTETETQIIFDNTAEEHSIFSAGVPYVNAPAPLDLPLRSAMVCKGTLNRPH